MSRMLVEIIQTTLFGISVCALVIGVLLIAIPGKFIEATAGLNRWISTDDFFEELDRARPTERYIYRYHRAVGALIALGGLYVFYNFAFVYDVMKLLPVLPTVYNHAASAWLYESLGWIFTAVGAIAVVAGLTVVLRPSLLKKVEQWGNRWVETGKLARGLDGKKDLPVHWFPGKARWFGWFIVGGSLLIIYLTGPVVWGG